MSDVEKVVAEWTAAMEGVSPGPWVNDAPGCVSVHYPEGGKATICTTPWERREDIANAAWIARCSPAGIRSLLDLIAHQAARLEEKDAFIEEARPHVAKIAGCIRINNEWGRVVTGQTEAAAALRDIFARAALPKKEQGA